MKASVIDSLFVHHVFPSSNCPLHEHVLSSHRGRLLLFHGRVFHCRSSWPPTDLTERIVHFAKKKVCHLVAFQWYAACWCIICPKLQLPRPRASRAFAWRQVAALPRLDLRRGDPSASLCIGRCTWGLGAQGTPSMKASKAATSMVYHVGRAPDHGAGQGIEQKLMVAPRCGTSYGHTAALAIVMLIQPCTPVHGVHNVWVDHPAS